MQTALTDLLGIEQPLVLAPMGTWANVSLAAAVSNGGGLGTFGAVGRLMGLTAQVVRDNLAALSDLTDRPIGAGFITQLIPESPENLDIVLEAGVPVVLFSFADPTPYVGLARDAAATVVCQVYSFEAAQQAVDAGADVIAVQGDEAGGHGGRGNLLPFLTRVLDAYPNVPVIAAGGMSNGRSLAAVLAAGAVGAWVGTAFLAAVEATNVTPDHLAALMASDGTDTMRNRVFDILLSASFRGQEFPEGVEFRARPIPLMAEWDGREDELRERVAELVPAFRAGFFATPDYSPLMYGQGARSVTETLPAAEIIARMVGDAERCLARVAG
jgi:nitronate monooxygenase